MWSQFSLYMWLYFIIVPENWFLGRSLWMSKALGQPVVKLFISFFCPLRLLSMAGSDPVWAWGWIVVCCIRLALYHTGYTSVSSGHSEPKWGGKGSMQKEENHLQNKELWMPSPSPAPAPSPGSSCVPATFSFQLSYYFIVTQQFCLVCTWLKGFCFCLRPKGYRWSQACLSPALHQLIK